MRPIIRVLAYANIGPLKDFGAFCYICFKTFERVGKDELLLRERGATEFSVWLPDFIFSSLGDFWIISMQAINLLVKHDGNLMNKLFVEKIFHIDILEQ
jgi:hypothetical protein